MLSKQFFAEEVVDRFKAGIRAITMICLWLGGRFDCWSSGAMLCATYFTERFDDGILAPSARLSAHDRRGSDLDGNCRAEGRILAALPTGTVLSGLTTNGRNEKSSERWLRVVRRPRSRRRT